MFCNLCFLLSLIFVILKLANVLTISWLLALVPAMIPIVLWLIGLLIVIIWTFFALGASLRGR